MDPLKHDEEQYARDASAFTDKLGEILHVGQATSDAPSTVNLAELGQLVTRYQKVASGFIRTYIAKALASRDPGWLRTALPVAVALSDVQQTNSPLQELFEAAGQLGAVGELELMLDPPVSGQ
ncbi:hypothetical protein QFZ65_002622 [Arthrobacter sp. B3I9]|uniref:hypothetical protein n=1 Tax=Arthrobacter sp. B3I9 TaxID=3042270 RepID=UPI002791DEF1|nr:hypothetical protein [Arthrobacter sp. B3I9]MDQ0850684.1 hypothetical protein [Arthrobacter sp. B3I9]